MYEGKRKLSMYKARESRRFNGIRHMKSNIISTSGVLKTKHKSLLYDIIFKRSPCIILGQKRGNMERGD